YIPFEFDLGPKYLRRGTNTLVVRADSRRNLDSIPLIKITSTGIPSSGWWNYSGILREVYVRRVYKVDMGEFLARPLLPCRTCAGSVLLRATLRNMTSKKQKVSVRASVDSVHARLPSVVLPPFGVQTVATKVGIRSPRLWEPGNPNLYQVTAEAYDGKRA